MTDERVDDLLTLWAMLNMFLSPILLTLLVDHIRVEPSPLLEFFFLMLPAALFFMFAPVVLVDHFRERDCHERRF